MRPWIVAAFVMLPVAGAGVARAESKKSGGALSQVISGMKRQSGQTARPAASNTPDHGNSQGAVADYAPDTHRAGYYDPTPVVVGPSYGTGADANVDLYFALQRVDDSNGAAIASLRASSGEFGLVLSDSAYYEQVRTLEGTDTIGLHVWTIGGAYRVHHTPSASGGRGREVWLTGGLAGANSEGLQLWGAAVGAELEQPLKGELGAFAAGRYLLYQDDIRGVEMRGGLAASILRLSYRFVEFNVGPPLRGPEVGLALRF